MPTLVVIGPAKAGKSTASKMFSAFLREKYGDTSDVIYERLAEKLGVRVESLRAIPKEELRPALVEMGNALCEETPAAISLELYRRGCRIISGIRRRRELLAFCDRIESTGEKVWVVWMHRPGHKPPADNTEVGPHDADFRAVNNGTVSDLFHLVERLSTHIAGRCQRVTPPPTVIGVPVILVVTNPPARPL